MLQSSSPFGHLFGASPEPDADPDPFGRIGSGNPDWESARGRWMEGASLRDIFGDSLFRLNDTVGTGRANQRGDVFKMQAMLHREGMLDAEVTGGPTGYWGNRDDAAMRDYQKADGSMPVDGWAGPDGPTMKALRNGYEPPERYAQAVPMVMSDAAPAAPAPAVSGPAATNPATPKEAWAESPIHAAFRDAIHKKESEGAENSGYGATNNGAYGRYQMRVPALKDAGMIDADGKWAGKYGVRSEEEFLRNPKAQEKAFADFMARTEGYIRQVAPGYEGRRIEGRLAPFEVTEAGLIAAAHRQGAGMLEPYFEFQEKNNWKSGNFEKIPDSVVAKIAKLQDGIENPQSADRVLRSIETRLREFSTIPYRRVAPGS